MEKFYYKDGGNFMELNYGSNTYRSLTEFAGQSVQNREFARTMGEKGGEIIDKAIDTFFKADRELVDARTSINELKDLEKAMKACMDKVKADRESNTEGAQKKADELNNSGTLQKGKTETFNDAQRLVGDDHFIPKEKLINKKPLKKGGILL